jgi:S1-C subfamily serine protease
MKSFIGGCVVGGLFLMAYYGGNQPILRAADPPVASAQYVLAYAVEIDIPGFTGSGVIVASAGGVTEIATCDHVVRPDRKKPAVVSPDIIYQGATFTGRTVREDERNDLALITVAGQIGPAAPIYPEAVTAGAEELVVGSPYGRGVEITQGYASRYTYPLGVDQLRLQGSAATWPGNSGGPVFVFNPQHHRWEVAGIMGGIWYANNTEAIPNINYAIPASSLLLFVGWTGATQ